MRDYDDRSRKLARERYWEEHDKNEYECPDCERTIDEIEGTFEVHHKNGRVLDNKPENMVALCRCCHRLREGKKPNKDIIRNLRDQAGLEDQTDTASKIESVYLAGTMDYYNSEDSWWSSSITEEQIGSKAAVGWRDVLDGIPLTIKSPRDVHFDHGGDLVSGIAGADIQLLESADSIIAYFSKKEQVGTLSELIHAVNNSKPALVMIDISFLPDYKTTKTTVHDPREAQDVQQKRWIHKPLSMRVESPTYWFLINYLLGDKTGHADGSGWSGVEPDVEIAVVSDAEDIQKACREWIHYSIIGEGGYD